jgi:hypothetical protein
MRPIIGDGEDKEESWPVALIKAPKEAGSFCARKNRKRNG